LGLAICLLRQSVKVRAREHFPVFCEIGIGGVERGRLSDDNVGINHDPKRDHPRFGSCARVASMI